MMTSVKKMDGNPRETRQLQMPENRAEMKNKETIQERQFIQLASVSNTFIKMQVSQE